MKTHFISRMKEKDSKSFLILFYLVAKKETMIVTDDATRMTLVRGSFILSLVFLHVLHI